MQKTLEDNHHQVELLKEQADQLERNWKEKKSCDVAEWKEKVCKQQEHWQTRVECHKLARKREAEQHAHDLILHSHAPVSHGKFNSRISASTSVSSSTHSTSRHSKPVMPSEKQNVRFMSTHTVHILDEPLVEESESFTGTATTGGATDASAAVASRSVEEVIDLSKSDGDYLSPADDTEEQALGGEGHRVSSLDAFTVTTESARTGDVLPDDFKATNESAHFGDEMPESASINTLASDVVQSAIEGAVERVSTPTTLPSETSGPVGGGEPSAVSGQGSDVSIATMASDVVERAVQGAVERVATPSSSQ